MLRVACVIFGLSIDVLLWHDAFCICFNSKRFDFRLPVTWCLESEVCSWLMMFGWIYVSEASRF